MSYLAPVFLAVLQSATDSTGTRIVVEQSWIETAANLAQSLISLLVLVMIVMGVLLLYALRKSIDELTKLVRGAHEPLRAALTEVREVTGEVRAIAVSLKAPVALAGETIEDASDRVRSAMDLVQGRLARFETLVEIAQEEAEGAVVSAASLLRGVRAGGAVVSRSLGLLKRKPATHPSRNRGARRRSAGGTARVVDDVDDPPDADDVIAADGSAPGDEGPRIRARATARQ